MTTKLVPPDGGWGWMVALAMALSSMMTIPLMQAFDLIFKQRFKDLGITVTQVSMVTIPLLQGFGLIFEERFKDLGITDTQSSIIMNLSSAFGSCMALMNGPLFRTFECRTICIAGSVCYSVGMILTTFATTFVEFVLIYGMLSSLGRGLIASSLMLAMTSYFINKRGRAIGLTMTIIGLGSIIMPQIIYFLTTIYGKQGTVLILGGFSLHTIVSALLLQPVEWHMKEVEVLVEDEPADNIKDLPKISLTGSIIDCDIVGSTYSFETIMPGKKSMNPALNTTMQGKSREAINLGSSMKIFDEKTYHFLSKDDRCNDETELNRNHRTGKESEAQIEENEELVKEPDVDRPSWLRALVILFDFDLLRDPIFVNAMLGLSISLGAEINFSVMTPFVLSDMDFRTDQVATIISVLSFADLISRAITPYVGEWLEQTPRNMFLISLFMLVASRIGLIFSTSFSMITVVAIGFGIAKGVWNVYRSLVIPSCVPIEKFASASGIQMVCHGVLLLTVGSLIGSLRGSEGSIMFIAAINCLSVLTIVMWLVEMCIVAITKRKKERKKYKEAGQREIPA